MSSRQQAFDFFCSRRWTPAQSAGLTANLETESRFNVAIVGDGGLAYAIAQWHPDRQANFAKVFGKPIQGSTLDEQLAFVDWELRNSEKHAGDALAACTTPEDAGATVSRLYERPADHDGEARKRGALAREIYVACAGVQPSAPIEDHSTELPPQEQSQSQPQGAAMGTLSTFLVPLLMSVVGKFVNPQVAQNVQSIVTGGADKSTSVQNLLNMLLGAVATAAGTTPEAMKADDSVAIKAAAAVQSDAAKLQAVEDAAAAHLNAVMPFVQQMALLDQMRYDAENKGKMTVSSIAIAEHAAGMWDMTRTVVYIAGGVLTAITVGLLSAIITQSMGSKGTIDPGLLGLSGPILMATVTAWAAIIAYRFDGSKESHAAAEAARATEQYRMETGR